MAESNLKKTVAGRFDAVLAKVAEALATEGFGILTQIDVTKTLKEKLDVDFRRYRILGACNPPLAHQALSADPEIGLLLPCNVLVYEEGDGQTVVSAVDPLDMISRRDNPDLARVARIAREKLAHAIALLD